MRRENGSETDNVTLFSCMTVESMHVSQSPSIKIYLCSKLDGHVSVRLFKATVPNVDRMCNS